jgi:hypothetical protein
MFNLRFETNGAESYSLRRQSNGQNATRVRKLDEKPDLIAGGSWKFSIAHPGQICCKTPHKERALVLRTPEFLRS